MPRRPMTEEEKEEARKRREEKKRIKEEDVVEKEVIEMIEENRRELLEEKEIEKMKFIDEIIVNKDPFVDAFNKPSCYIYYEALDDERMKYIPDLLLFYKELEKHQKELYSTYNQFQIVSKDPLDKNSGLRFLFSSRNKSTNWYDFAYNPFMLQEHNIKCIRIKEIYPYGHVRFLQDISDKEEGDYSFFEIKILKF